MSIRIPERSARPTRLRCERSVFPLMLATALAAGCSYQNPLSDSGKAFRSGAASWGTLSLAQTYAATLRDARQDCFLTLFDVDTIAAKAYDHADATTKSEAQKLITSVYEDQRRIVGSSYPGRILFQADGGNEQVVLPPVYRAYRSPLDECPNRAPELAGASLEGEAEGTLLVEFPYRGKALEMRARLSERGARVISIPVLRDIDGTVFREAAPPPPPPPVTAPVPAPTPVTGQPLP